jgi:hypothetical protein
MWVEFFVALVSAIVVTFRVSSSARAYSATAALSWLLLFFLPVGTALFVYWIRKVRPSERPAQTR